MKDVVQQVTFSPVSAPRRHWEVFVERRMMDQKACVRVWDGSTDRSYIVSLLGSTAGGQQVSQGSQLLARLFQSYWEGALGEGGRGSVGG